MYHIVFDTVRKKHPKGDPPPSHRIQKNRLRVTDIGEIAPEQAHLFQG